MALKFGFFNSVNGDRKYNADDMTHPYDMIVSNGVIADTDGSTSFKVGFQSETQIYVNKGKGIFDKKWCFSDSVIYFKIPPLSVNKICRYDNVVVRVDNENRNISIEYVTGTESESEEYSSSLFPKVTRTDKITEYLLAQILYAPNSDMNQYLTTAERYVGGISIFDKRASNDCGIVSNLLQDSDLSSLYDGWKTNFEDWFDDVNFEYGIWVQNRDDTTNRWISEKTSEFNGLKGDWDLQIRNKIFECENATNEANRQATFCEQAMENLDGEFENWKEDKDTEKETLFNNFQKAFDQLYQYHDVNASKYINQIMLKYNNESSISESIISYIATENQSEFAVETSNKWSVVDIIQVYINGLRIWKDVDFTLATNGSGYVNKITLNKAVDEGTQVVITRIPTTLRCYSS